LFVEEVAKAAVYSLHQGDFNVQEMANTAKAFGKKDQRHQLFFEEVVEAAMYS
jgi:hypothetical protein